jgi:hypothetical protein
MNELKAHQRKRQEGDTNQTESLASPKRSLARSKRGPGSGDCHHDCRDQQREKADADSIFGSHSSPLQNTYSSRRRLVTVEQSLPNKLIAIRNQIALLSCER